MIKRIVSIAMMAVFTVAMISGFTSRSSAKVVTLTLWQQAAFKTPLQTATENEFLKENPNIKFNIVEQADMSTSAYLSAIAAGNAPSVFAAGYPSTMSYIFENAVLPIDDYIAKTPDFKNFDKSQVDTFKINGKHYAVPVDKYVMGFYYNKALFKAAGIAHPPTTWSEFQADAKKLTVPSKQQYGFGIDGTQWASWHFEQWVWGAVEIYPKRTVTAQLL